MTHSDWINVAVAAGTIGVAFFTAFLAWKTRGMESATRDMVKATRDSIKAEDSRLEQQLDAQTEERRQSDERRRSNLIRAAREEVTIALEVLSAPMAEYAWTQVAHDLLDQLISSDVALQEDDAVTLVRTVGVFRRYNALASMHNGSPQSVALGAMTDALRRLSTAAKAAADECVLALAIYVGAPAGFFTAEERAEIEAEAEATGRDNS